MKVSFERIERFLALPEVQAGLKSSLPEESLNDVEIKGNFTWGVKQQSGKKSKKSAKKQETASDVTLKGIDLKVKKGEFICIIGDVACGKSSLLHAIIGDMIYLTEN
jgi:ATP-binding cassette, subfamily C (CFTR/MRP), member 2